MTDYEKICDFENLYKAHIVARRCKRYKTDVIKFEMNLAQNLVRLRQQLENRTYKMGEYYSFVIYEPKRRRIYAAYYIDRVLQHCICDEVLSPILQKRLIYDNAACQVGKGTQFALKRLSKFMHEHYKKHGTTGYFLKCDIKKYFASIDQQVLKNKLAKVVLDEDVKNLLFHIIDSYETEGTPGIGLPLGNQTSQWFALYYLDSFDRVVKEKLRIKHYVRYMDDCLLIHEDKAYLKEILEILRKFAEEELHLEFNNKTQIFPLKNGVEFIGFHFYLTESGKVIRKMKTASKLRYKRRLKKLQKQYAMGEVTLAEIKTSLSGYKGHLMQGHTYKLKAKALQEFVLRREGDEHIEGE